MMKNTETGFNYTYSAAEQEEIRKIREKYQPKKEDDMGRLRRLDAKVTQKATVNSLITGILGALVLGIGMSLIMTDLGTVFQLQGTVNIVIGVAVGVIGMILMGTAYPVYSKVLKREREKAAPKILRISETLIK